MKIYDSSEFALALARLDGRGTQDCAPQLAAVRDIIKNVEERGDDALFEYTKRFDGFDVSAANLRVSQAEIDAAYAALSQETLEVMRRSAANIREYHELQMPNGFRLRREGAWLEQIVRPLSRAGVYVPGGKAAYPSSVLMNIIPAKVAGVPEIIVATPANAKGELPAATVVAACEAGADAIYKMGGAQAVAALALGTKSVPRADKITGPGNIFVALAKRELFGRVGIDMIAGPSEILVIADESADPRIVAADLLSQAEHDELAASILITPSKALAAAAAEQALSQAKSLPRCDIVYKSLESYGTIITCKDLDEAVVLADRIAPEHLELMCSDAEERYKTVKNAGSVFVGMDAPEPLGDYFAGVNHVLPTNGTARFASPLSVEDFIKRMSALCYDDAALAADAADVAAFARAEGLEAHARSAEIRTKKAED